MRDRWARRIRLALGGLGAVALAGGLSGGLERMGWALPSLAPGLPAAHGPLMISGAVGTLIGLERAVALRSPWAYAAPIASGLGGVMLLAGPGGSAGPALMTLGSVGLVAVSVRFVRMRGATPTIVMALSALLWLAANAAWLSGTPVPAVVPWLAGFLVLMIVGERLELGRLLSPPPGRRCGLMLALALYLAGLVLVPPAPGAGRQVAGAGMTALALWLLSNDVARHTVRRPGLPRFIAVALLSGYVWLGAGGVLWMLYDGGAPAGGFYDAAVHAVFLGFVFAMIFAHAPILMPAMLGTAPGIPAGSYGPLVLLHLSLVVRLAGDLGGSVILRRWGGLLGVCAILAFTAATAWTAAAWRPRRPLAARRGA